MSSFGFGMAGFLLVALAGGCTVEQGGLGSTTGASEGSTSAGTTAADGTASSGGGTAASSSDATAGSSTGGSGTGPAESSTGSSTESPPSESSSGSEGGETDGPSPAEGEPYGPCGPGSSCSGVDVACYENGGQDMCLPPCDGTNPSCPPAPPDNAALVECVEVPATPHCMLNCAGGGDASCPAGTSCVDLGGIFRCLWP